jgi:hypothetical protein
MVFIVIVLGLMVAKTILIRMLPHGSDQAATYVVDKILKFGVFLLASWIMAKIEARTIADYGLPWRKMFGHQFWKGAVIAFLGLAGFLTASRVAGVFASERSRCTAARFGNGVHSMALDSLLSRWRSNSITAAMACTR